MVSPDWLWVLAGRIGPRELYKTCWQEWASENFLKQNVLAGMGHHTFLVSFDFCKCFHSFLLFDLLVDIWYGVVHKWRHHLRGGGGQPKVTDGKLSCYFARKIGKNDDGGGRGSKIPQNLMTSFVNDPICLKFPNYIQVNWCILYYWIDCTLFKLF